jgi:hypothetical protein
VLVVLAWEQEKEGVSVSDFFAAMPFLIPLVACLIIGWMESDGGGGEGRGVGVM